MTQQEALKRVAELSETHPDRASQQWHARQESEGVWTVIRIPVPPNTPIGTETRADERPPNADDPRPNTWRDLGGPWVAGG